MIKKESKACDTYRVMKWNSLLTPISAWRHHLEWASSIFWLFFINGNMCQTSEKEETLQRNKKQFNLSAQDQDFSTSSAVQLLKVTWIFHHSSHICWGQVMPKPWAIEALDLRWGFALRPLTASRNSENFSEAFTERLSPFSCSELWSNLFFGAMTQSS